MIQIQAVKIEEKQNQRILIMFNPQEESIRFIGQFKINGSKWLDFCEEKHSMDINLETIQEILFLVYEKMKKRIDAFKDIMEGFSVIKIIEIAEENNSPDLTDIITNDVYGTLNDEYKT